MLENYNSMWLILKYQFLRSKLIYYECLFFHLWFNFYRETGIEGIKYLLGKITFALDDLVVGGKNKNGIWWNRKKKSRSFQIFALCLVMSKALFNLL